MTKPKTLGVILAGGRSARMGANKASLELGGKPLIHHVYERLAPQVDEVVISGPLNFSLPVKAIKDNHPDLLGPMAGLFATTQWAKENFKHCLGFYTVPVDAPFLPLDLVERLSGSAPCYAATKERDHPTFANWGKNPWDLLGNFIERGQGRSLLALAEFAKARVISFDREREFTNINTPEDLKKASRILTTF